MSSQPLPVPTMDQIRCDTGISTIVSQLLVQYDLQARSKGIQGKGLRKKLGRYNTTDTTSAAPELRWPN